MAAAGQVRPVATGHTVRWVPLLILCLTLAATAVVRVPYLAIPLERDEGEFAYGGQMLLAGEAPYVSFHAMKLPGIYLAYAAIEAVFGQTVAAIHLGLLLVNLATIALIYRLGSVVFDHWIGAAAALIYAVASVSPSVEGLQAQAEHFVLLPALLGVLSLLRAQRRDQLFWYGLSGLAYGTALLSKQHGAAFSLFAVIYLALTERVRWRTTPGRTAAKLAILLTGIALPLLGVCLAMIAYGALGPFVFWTFSYAQKYATAVSLLQVWKPFASGMEHQLKWSAGLWLAAGLGALIVAGSRELRSKLVFVAPFALGSIIATSLSGYFRIHYFVFMLPLLALLAAVAVRRVASWFGPHWVVGSTASAFMLGVAAAWPAIEAGRLYASRDLAQISRDLFGATPFPDSEAVGRYVAEHTAPTDGIAVFGSEPQIFFLARRRSVTPHLYLFPMMESHPFAVRMQTEMIDQVEAAEPKYIVLVRDNMSLAPEPNSHRGILRWFDAYLSRYYTMELRVDYFDDRPATFVSDEVGLTSPPTSQSFMLICRRKGN